MTLEPDVEGEDEKENLVYQGNPEGVPAVRASICIDVEPKGELPSEPSSIEPEKDSSKETLIASPALDNTIIPSRSTLLH